MPKKVCLLILDGWGIAPKPDFSAIEIAKTPVSYTHLTQPTKA